MQIEKIHDIQRHLGANDMNEQGDPSRRRVGVINLRFVRCLAFLVISCSVVACAAMAVLAVWEYVSVDIAWRSLTSLGIVSFATGVFVALNGSFGPAVRG